MFSPDGTLNFCVRNSPLRDAGRHKVATCIDDVTDGFCSDDIIDFVSISDNEAAVNSRQKGQN